MILPALGKVRTILQDVLLPTHVTHLSTADPVTVSGSKTHEEHKNQTRNYARWVRLSLMSMQKTRIETRGITIKDAILPSVATI